MRLFIGGYGADLDGNATGIGVLHAGSPDEVSAGGELSRRAEAAARAESPSWIAWHPTLSVVYAALEGRGAVQAFRRTGPEAFAPLGVPVAAGQAVCHVGVAPDGRALIAACWGDGRLVRIELDADGALGARSELPVAEDPYAGSGIEALERTSRAHQTRFLPAGGFVTTDLGFDLVRFWRAGAGRPDRIHGQVALPLGSGPRHLRRHPSGYLFVVTEISDELFVLGLQPGGGWGIVGGTQLSPAVIPGADSAAEIAFSRDGRFAYVGIRGTDTIAVLELRGDGAQVRPVALVESGVVWPRHHLVVRDTLLVAGQRSDEIALLTLDLRTGVPGRARRRVDAPTPTCLLPDRD